MVFSLGHGEVSMEVFGIDAARRKQHHDRWFFFSNGATNAAFSILVSTSLKRRYFAGFLELDSFSA